MNEALRLLMESKLSPVCVCVVDFRWQKHFGQA